MVQMDNRKPDVEVAAKEMPFYFRSEHPTGNTYIWCGEVKRGGNEPYCFTEEKQCANHFCRVLMPENVIENALVIRDDGTVWKIWLPAFVEWNLLNITW